jgi:carbon-monoxide dehydrogenase medium subunit
VRAIEAEAVLRNNQITPKTMEASAEAARAAADPQPDMRGSAEYKRQLVVALVKRGMDVALRRARGERVELSHIYA